MKKALNVDSTTKQNVIKSRVACKTNMNFEFLVSFFDSSKSKIFKMALISSELNEGFFIKNPYPR
jgi:predicted homoserine dehydrogenase-like protein